MPMEVSMGYVAPAFCAMRKTVTRRDWKSENYVRMFREGKLCTALSAQRKFGGKPIGEFQITEEPYREEMGVHDTEDKIAALYEAEGFAFMDNAEFVLVDMLAEWVASNDNLLVMPFKITKVDEVYAAKLKRPAELRKARAKLLRGILGDAAVYECEVCKEPTLKLHPYQFSQQTLNICGGCLKAIEEGGIADIEAIILKQKTDDAEAFHQEEKDEAKARAKEKGVEGWVCPDCDTVNPDDADSCGECDREREIENEEKEEADEPEEE